MSSATSVFNRQPAKEKGDLQSELLKNFAASNGTAFPVVATLVGCDDAETVLEKFNVRCGTELVVHGWTRQSKVLAGATTPNRYCAIPLTYVGQFRLRSFRKYHVRDLDLLPSGVNQLRVVDIGNYSFPLHVGDVIAVKQATEPTFSSFQATALDVSRHIVCELMKPEGPRDVTISLDDVATFEEVTEISRLFIVRDLKDELPVQVELDAS